jgi:hypothetical protein
MAQAEALRAQGLLYREIAPRLGVPVSTLCNWLQPSDRAKRLSAQKRERAQQLRREGHKLMDIAAWLHISRGVVEGATAGVKIDRRPRVKWDGRCWRIYIFDHANYREEDDEPQQDILWWPLEYMQFASREVAEAHLEREAA